MSDSRSPEQEPDQEPGGDDVPAGPGPAERADARASVNGLLHEAVVLLLIGLLIAAGGYGLGLWSQAQAVGFLCAAGLSIVNLRVLAAGIMALIDDVPNPFVALSWMSVSFFGMVAACWACGTWLPDGIVGFAIGLTAPALYGLRYGMVHWNDVPDSALESQDPDGDAAWKTKPGAWSEGWTDVNDWTDVDDWTARPDADDAPADDQPDGTDEPEAP